MPVRLLGARPSVLSTLMKLVVSTELTAAVNWPRLTASVAPVPAATLTMRRWFLTLPTDTVLA